MKTTLFMSLALVLSSNIANAYVPYYMEKADSSKINAIKINQACDDCGDCSGSEVINPFKKQQFIDVKNATTQKAVVATIIITELKKS